MHPVVGPLYLETIETNKNAGNENFSPSFPTPPMIFLRRHFPKGVMPHAGLSSVVANRFVLVFVRHSRRRHHRCLSRWTFVTLFEASSNKPLVAAAAQPSGITTNDRSSTSNDETTDSIAASEEVVVVVVVACLYSRNSHSGMKEDGWKKRSSRTRKLFDFRVLLRSSILTVTAEAADRKITLS